MHKTFVSSCGRQLCPHIVDGLDSSPGIEMKDRDGSYCLCLEYCLVVASTHNTHNTYVDIHHAVKYGGVCSLNSSNLQMAYVYIQNKVNFTVQPQFSH